jgi:tmRNA-binding protein
VAKQKKVSPGTIAQNKKARFEYHLHEKFEAGLALEGWEIKSIRAGRVQLTDTYVFFKKMKPFCWAPILRPCTPPQHMSLLKHNAFESYCCIEKRLRD